MDRLMDRPKPLHVPPLRARAKRHDPDRGWYWQVVQEGGKRSSVWSGYGTVREVAKRMADLVSSGVISSTVSEAEPGEIRTVADLLEAWMGSSVDLRVETGALTDSTRAVYEAHGRQLRRHLGGVDVFRLDARVLERYDLDRLRSGAAKGTVHLERVILGAAWRWGMEVGLVPHRQLPKTAVRPSPRERYVPTRAEVARVLEHVTGWRWLALRLQYATGARISEVCALRISDVDVDTATVRITHGKTGARDVPVAPAVAELVRRWVETERAGAAAGDSLLRPQGCPSHPAAQLNGVLGRACKAAGVTRWSTHALRYRAVMDMLDAGVDPRTACEITGHSLQTMLSTYRQVSSAGKRAAVARAQLGHLPDGQVVDLQSRRRE